MTDDMEYTIASYVEALRPIIYFPTKDYQAVTHLIERAIGKDYDLLPYNLGEGHTDFHTGLSKRIQSLEGFLSLHLEVGLPPTALLLRDVHHELKNPEIQALLQSIALKQMYTENYRCVVFMMNSRKEIPSELEAYTTIIDLPKPSDHQVEQIVREFGGQQQIEIEESVIQKLKIAFKGLSKLEIIQILNLAYQQNGEIEARDEVLILKEKEQFVQKSGMLEIIPVNTSLDEIGGLEVFKEWIIKKSKVFHRIEDAVQAGLDMPKGTLIAGVPGSGKSLAAKATAEVFNIPLLRFDIGRLMGKYVGESEHNLHEALKIAEAVSPCVLWIDEIEKSFVGVGESEVTTRLFGTFLTWMQEKESHVFIVATANDISSLPPEFLRKGRFDELFMVDLPSKEERQQILKVHLTRRKQSMENIDLPQIVLKTKGYSGADLEAIVKQAVEDAFLQGKKGVTTEGLLKCTEEMKSLSDVLGDELDKQRKQMQKYNLKEASL